MHLQDAFALLDCMHKQTYALACSHMGSHFSVDSYAFSFEGLGLPRWSHIASDWLRVYATHPQPRGEYGAFEEAMVAHVVRALQHKVKRFARQPELRASLSDAVHVLCRNTPSPVDWAAFSAAITSLAQRLALPSSNAVAALECPRLLPGASIYRSEKDIFLLVGEESTNAQLHEPSTASSTSEQLPHLPKGVFSTTTAQLSVDLSTRIIFEHPLLLWHSQGAFLSPQGYNEVQEDQWEGSELTSSAWTEVQAAKGRTLAVVQMARANGSTPIYVLHGPRKGKPYSQGELGFFRRVAWFWRARIRGWFTAAETVLYWTLVEKIRTKGEGADMLAQLCARTQYANGRLPGCKRYSDQEVVARYSTYVGEAGFTRIRALSTMVCGCPLQAYGLCVTEQHHLVLRWRQPILRCYYRRYRIPNCLNGGNPKPSPQEHIAQQERHELRVSHYKCYSDGFTLRLGRPLILQLGGLPGSTAVGAQRVGIESAILDVDPNSRDAINYFRDRSPLVSVTLGDALNPADRVRALLHHSGRRLVAILSTMSCGPQTSLNNLRATQGTAREVKILSASHSYDLREFELHGIIPWAESVSHSTRNMGSFPYTTVSARYTGELTEDVHAIYHPEHCPPLFDNEVIEHARSISQRSCSGAKRSFQHLGLDGVPVFLGERDSNDSTRWIRRPWICCDGDTYQIFGSLPRGVTHNDWCRATRNDPAHIRQTYQLKNALWPALGSIFATQQTMYYMAEQWGVPVVSYPEAQADALLWSLVTSILARPVWPVLPFVKAYLILMPVNQRGQLLVESTGHLLHVDIPPRRSTLVQDVSAAFNAKYSPLTFPATQLRFVGVVKSTSPWQLVFFSEFLDDWSRHDPLPFWGRHNPLPDASSLCVRKGDVMELYEHLCDQVALGRATLSFDYLILRDYLFREERSLVPRGAFAFYPSGCFRYVGPTTSFLTFQQPHEVVQAAAHAAAPQARFVHRTRGGKHVQRARASQLTKEEAAQQEAAAFEARLNACAMVPPFRSHDDARLFSAWQPAPGVKLRLMQRASPPQSEHSKGQRSLAIDQGYNANHAQYAQRYAKLRKEHGLLDPPTSNKGKQSSAAAAKDSTDGTDKQRPTAKAKASPQRYLASVPAAFIVPVWRGSVLVQLRGSSLSLLGSREHSVKPSGESKVLQSLRFIKQRIQPSAPVPYTQLRAHYMRERARGSRIVPSMPVAKEDAGVHWLSRHISSRKCPPYVDLSADNLQRTRHPPSFWRDHCIRVDSYFYVAQFDKRHSEPLRRATLSESLYPLVDIPLQRALQSDSGISMGDCFRRWRSLGRENPSPIVKAMHHLLDPRCADYEHTSTFRVRVTPKHSSPEAGYTLTQQAHRLDVPDSWSLSGVCVLQEHGNIIGYDDLSCFDKGSILAVDPQSLITHLHQTYRTQTALMVATFFPSAEELTSAETLLSSPSSLELAANGPDHSDTAWVDLYFRPGFIASVHRGEKDVESRFYKGSYRRVKPGMLVRCQAARVEPHEPASHFSVWKQVKEVVLAPSFQHLYDRFGSRLLPGRPHHYAAVLAHRQQASSTVSCAVRWTSEDRACVINSFLAWRHVALNGDSHQLNLAKPWAARDVDVVFRDLYSKQYSTHESWRLSQTSGGSHNVVGFVLEAVPPNAVLPRIAALNARVAPTHARAVEAASTIQREARVLLSRAVIDQRQHIAYHAARLLQRAVRWSIASRRVARLHRAYRLKKHLDMLQARSRVGVSFVAVLRIQRAFRFKRRVGLLLANLDSEALSNAASRIQSAFRHRCMLRHRSARSIQRCFRRCSKHCKGKPSSGGAEGAACASAPAPLAPLASARLRDAASLLTPFCRMAAGVDATPKLVDSSLAFTIRDTEPHQYTEGYTHHLVIPYVLIKDCHELQTYEGCDALLADMMLQVTSVVKTASSTEWDRDVLVGWHTRPSVPRLHLHVIAPRSAVQRFKRRCRAPHFIELKDWCLHYAPRLARTLGFRLEACITTHLEACITLQRHMRHYLSYKRRAIAIENTYARLNACILLQQRTRLYLSNKRAMACEEDVMQKTTRSGRAYNAVALTIDEQISRANALLSESRMFVKDVERDGSCLFHCGSDAYVDADGTLRAAVVELCARRAYEDSSYAQSLLGTVLYKPRVDSASLSAHACAYNALFDAIATVDFTKDFLDSPWGAVKAYECYMGLPESYAGEHEVSAMATVLCRCIEVVQYVPSTDALGPIVTHTPALVDTTLSPLRLLFSNAHYSVISAIPVHLLQVRHKHICRHFICALRDTARARTRLRSLLWLIFRRSRDAASRIQAHTRRRLVCAHLKRQLVTCVQQQHVVFPPLSTNMAVVLLAQRGRALVQRARRPVSSAVSRGSIFGGGEQTSTSSNAAVRTPLKDGRPYQYRTVRKKLRFKLAPVVGTSTEAAPTSSL